MNLKINKKLLVMFLTGSVALVGGCTKTNNEEAFENKEIIYFSDIDDEITLPEEKQVSVVTEEYIEDENSEINPIEFDEDAPIRLEDLDYKYIFQIKTLNNIDIIDNTNKVIGHLNKDTIIDAKVVNDELYKINYLGEEAFIKRSDNIEETYRKEALNETLKMVCISDDTSLYNNIEEKEKVLKLAKGEIVEVLLENKDYYLVRYNNTLGFVRKNKTKELTDTFVVVDISDQELKIYDQGEIILDTPVVTGKKGVNDTPQGLHEIYEVTGGRWLLNNDGTNNVWVDCMLKFSGNVGLHPAEYYTEYDKDGNVVRKSGWRSTNSFGGTTYIGGGSHGCVNMLHEAAMFAYNHLEKGDKVLVKE